MCERERERERELLLGAWGRLPSVTAAIDHPDPSKRETSLVAQTGSGGKQRKMLCSLGLLSG
jgi:hypothetical protein